jgi:signal transduction histidine kinase
MSESKGLSAKLPPKERIDLSGLQEEITDAASQAESLEEAVRPVLERVCEACGFSCGHVYRVLDRGQPLLVPTGVWYGSGRASTSDFRQVSEYVVFRSGEGIPGQVLSTRDPVWIARLFEGPEDPRLSSASALGLRSALAFPIKVGPDVVAVLEYFSSDPDFRPSPHLLELLGRVGERAGLTVQRERWERNLAAAVWEEQQRLARELHDFATQDMIAAALLTEHLTKRLGESQASETETAREILEAIQRAITSVRAIIKDLRPVPVGRDGFIPALRDLLDSIKTRRGIHCSFQCDDGIRIHDDDTAVHLHAIAREALHNAVRHAHPKHILVELTRRAGVLCLTIQDDGIGFERSAPPQGYGLRIMRHRAQHIGASMRIDTGEPSGTKIVILLPEES